MLLTFSQWGPLGDFGARKNHATNPAFLILPMDSGSEYSEKMLEIPLLPGVFGPEKVKKKKKKTETDTRSESRRAKMPQFF